MKTQALANLKVTNVECVKDFYRQYSYLLAGDELGREMIQDGTANNTLMDAIRNINTILPQANNIALAANELLNYQYHNLMTYEQLIKFLATPILCDHEKDYGMVQCFIELKFAPLGTVIIKYIYSTYAFGDHILEVSSSYNNIGAILNTIWNNICAGTLREHEVLKNKYSVLEKTKEIWIESIINRIRNKND